MKSTGKISDKGLGSQVSSGLIETTDLVCGMEVEADSEYRYNYAGTTYLFCSEEDLQEFKDDPVRFLEAQ